MNRMSGWKTWTGAIGVVVTTAIIQYFGGDEAAIGDMAQAFLNLIETARIAFGSLTAVGVAHKVEKAGNANQ